MKVYENSIKVLVPPPNTVAGTLIINGERFEGVPHPNGYKFSMNFERVPKPNIAYPFVRWTKANGETEDEPLGEFNILRPERPKPEYAISGNTLTVYADNFDFDSGGQLQRTTLPHHTYFTNTTPYPIPIRLFGESFVLPPEAQVLDTTTGLLVCQHADNQNPIDLTQYTNTYAHVVVVGSGQVVASWPQNIAPNALIECYNVRLAATPEEFGRLDLNECTVAAPLNLKVGQSLISVLTTFESPDNTIAGDAHFKLSRFVQPNPNKFAPELLNGIPNTMTDLYAEIKAEVMK